jgi:hypothetical protein
MKRSGRLSVVLLSLLVAAGIGWLLNPSPAGGQDGQAQCAKPAGAKCGSKTIIVYVDGLHNGAEETFVCGGDQVDWQIDTAPGRVEDLTVHFDESPFDPNFGKGDYCAGAHCPRHSTGTDKLTARTKSAAPDYVRCHKYTVTVVASDGSSLTLDPHIIVGGTGNAN